MKIGLGQRLQRIRSDIANSHPIANLPWSAIRRIGQSRLLALTIVVPFLGSLLLFNQHVVELLTLSPELVRRWMNHTASGAEDAARQITLSRLYYVYFVPRNWISAILAVLSFDRKKLRIGRRVYPD